jgi:hypothetical protein
LLPKALQSTPRPVCLFVDGLDEIDRTAPLETKQLMEWIQKISSVSGVKLCVSSRPEAVFESKLKTLSHLKVQDLTSNDIRRYVEKSFANIELSLVISKDTVQSLVQTIIQKAESVFLWVRIVVDYVRSDMDSYSTPDRLLQRVEKLPPGLDQMYETMWNRYNADDDLYRAETAMYLNMLLDPRPKSLLLFFLASHQDV